jgi:hypothetical protein
MRVHVTVRARLANSIQGFEIYTGTKIPIEAIAVSCHAFAQPPYVAGQ